jgi:hypothetical protein
MRKYYSALGFILAFANHACADEFDEFRALARRSNLEHCIVSWSKNDDAGLCCFSKTFHMSEGIAPDARLAGFKFRELPPPSKFTPPTSAFGLSLNSLNMVDAKRLAAMKGLEFLDLYSAGVDRSMLEVLATNKSIRYYSLGNNKLSANDLAFIGNLDHVVSFVPSLPSYKHHLLCGAFMDDELLSKLKKERLFALGIFGRIDLSKPPSCNDEVEVAAFSMTNITAKSISRLQAFPKLRSLRLAYLDPLTAASLSAIVDLSHLQELSISGCNLDKLAMASVAKCRDLRRVWITASNVGNRELGDLAQLKTLESLGLWATDVTEFPRAVVELPNLRKVALSQFPSSKLDEYRKWNPKIKFSNGGE